MKKKSEVTKIVNGLYSALLTAMSGATSLQEAEAKKAFLDSFDKAHEAITSIVGIVESICIGTQFEGVFSPSFLSSFKSFDTDGKVDYIELTIKSKLKAKYPYRNVATIKVNDDFVEELVKAYADSLTSLLYITYAGENIDELNNRIDAIIAENEIPISFGFTIEDSSALISTIDNNRVVFNADIEQAFELATDPLFFEGDAYADSVRTTAESRFVELLKAQQTTPQIIKSGIRLITDLTGVKTKKRAERLIRQSYHKQAIYFNKVKEGIGYYNDTVTIDGEEVTIFALLKKNADGTIEVVLNPFNVKTLFAVDFDVVEAVKKAMV